MKICPVISIAKNIQTAYSQACQPILEEFDLLQISFDIIMFLANNPECSTAKEISELRNIKKNVVSNHVEKLVKVGYLERGTIAGDRRKIRLACTDKAKPVINAGRKLQQDFYNSLTGNIPEEKMRIMKEFLDILNQNATQLKNQTKNKR